MTQGADWSKPLFIRKRFPTESWRLILRYSYLPIALGAPVLALFYFVMGELPIYIALEFAKGVLIIYVVSVATTLVFKPIYSVELTPTTIAGGNDFCLRQTWDIRDVEWAEPKWYGAGFGLVVKFRGSRVRLWFPYFIAHKTEFLESFAQVAGTNNPLYIALDQKWNKIGKK